MLIAKGLFFILAVVSLRSAASPFEDHDAIVDVLTNEIRRWAQSGYQTRNLEEIIDALALPTELRHVDFRSFTGERASGICTVCKSMVKSVISMKNDGIPVEKIQETLSKLCTRMNFASEVVCRGVVKTNAPIILYIIDADSTITPEDVCGVVLQKNACTTASDKYVWTIEIDSEQPKIFEREVTNETIKIVHVTDIHYDPFYEPNGNSHCDDPTCCRKGQNVTNTSGKVAGYWGDYNHCDSPWHAVEDALNHLGSMHQDADYVYFTGDVIDHGVWETSKERNTESLIKSYNKMKETFKEIPVYPLIGNHEPHPLNVFAPNHITEEGLSTEWIYSLMANLWISYGWIPESTRNTILQGGFYTLSPRKGFRIIALNNNVCYSYNWWLIYEPRDPSGQLRWLADTLLEAEKNEEYVHILAHIPPRSHECYVAWSNEYRRIVNRFAHIITAQFNGHTHYDELGVFYDPADKSKPINVAWNGGSITPFANLNPNYKVYTVNANTHAVEDIDIWMYNLTRANETPEKNPEWYKSYSFKQEYNLENLSLASLNKWIVDMFSDKTKLIAYHQNYHKYADSVIDAECDEACLNNYLCNIVTTSANDKSQCEYLIASH